MQRFLFIFFCAILLWSPLPLGSHRVWSSALLECLVALLCALWLLRFREQMTTRALRHNKLIISLFFAIPCWTAIQIVPLPPELVLLLSPQHAHYIAPTQAWLPLSLDVGASLYKLQKSLAYAVFFVMALALINTPNRLNIAAQVLVMSGVLQAVYGVLVILGGPSFDILNIGMAADRPKLTSASGTFINRNNFAGYLEMCIAIGIGLLITQILLNKDSFAGLRASLRNIVFTLLSGKARLRVFFGLDGGGFSAIAFSHGKHCFFC